MRFKPIILCLCVVFVALSCLKDDETHKEDSPEAPVPYSMETPVVYETKLDGLSAICVNENKNGLYVAQDNGLLYEVGFDGTVKGTVPFESKHDWEGVTVDYETGTVYLSEEREWAVYKVNDDRKGVTLVNSVTVEGGTDNRGFEGIACGGGNLYLANQASPRRVFVWSLSENMVTSTFDFNSAGFLSDIFYDSRDGSLWITDSNKKKLYNIKAGGDLIGEYDISFVKKPEGFCIDTVNNCFWFCCDSTGKIYKVSYH